MAEVASGSTDCANESLREFVTSAGSSPAVDRDAGVIRGCKILGVQSRNRPPRNFSYPESTRAAAAKLYEGVVCNVDHHKPGTHISYHDRIGAFKSVECRQDGLYGDFHFNPKHALAEQICWDAEHAPQNLGFSHIADGKINRSDPAHPVVEEITAVESVDLVANPATTNGLFESEGVPDDQREFCEHGLSALSDARSIVLAGEPLETKRPRLMELLSGWKLEIYEGEIGDELAKDEAAQRLRTVNRTAENLIYDAIWDRENQFPTIEAKKARVLSILADWESELKNMPTVSGSTTAENNAMEWKDITVESLRQNREDLVEVLTGTDETSRMKQELQEARDALAASEAKIVALESEKAEQARELEIATELKEAKLDPANKTLVSDAFMTTLRAADGQEARKVLIEDRVALLKASREPARTTGYSPFGVVEGSASGGPADKKDLLGRL